MLHILEYVIQVQAMVAQVEVMLKREDLRIVAAFMSVDHVQILDIMAEVMEVVEGMEDS
jgi:hypothetical protein